MHKYFSYVMLAGVLLVNIASGQLIAIRKITADLNRVAGPKIKVFNDCVGAGRANEGLRADWQQQLTTVQQELGFRYIRFHGLLHDDMRVYTEDKNGNPVLNWQYIDKLFDFLLSIGIRPFVEFSFMPANLASGTKTIFWWKANVSKPKSYEKWDELITQLVLHWQERYGKEEVAKWYFEVWNEPDLKGFFDGEQADYFELYRHTALAVKKVSASYRTGGPATSATKWISEFLQYCDSSRLPLDFISTHDYGTTSVLDEVGTRKQKLKSNPDTIAINVQRVRRLIDASPFRHAELHFTEWNTSPSSRDPIHDTYQNAAYVLNTLKKAGDAAQSLSYWTFTDIFEEAGPGQTPLHGGFGLLNLQGIKKPTYYAYRFMNELGNMLLKNSDADSYVCKDTGGNVQALFWNYTFTETGTAFDQGYFIQPHPSVVQQNVELKINHIFNGRCRLETYKVGYGANDYFTTWFQMGMPAQLTRQQERQLVASSSGLPAETQIIQITNGIFTQAFPLRENDIVFVKLTKLKAS